MFTTTINKPAGKKEHRFQFAVGDVIEHAHGKRYMVKARHLNDVTPSFDLYDLTNVETGTVIDGYLMTPHALSRFKLIDRDGLVEQVEVVEHVTIEHKFQVGDIIQYRKNPWFTERKRTITAIGFRTSPTAPNEPFYFFDVDAYRCGDRVANVDNPNVYDAVLVGGPRFEAMEAEKAEAEKLDRLKVLRDARNLIATPESWTKGSLRGRRNGVVVQHCALGAVVDAAGVDVSGDPKIQPVLSALVKAINGDEDLNPPEPVWIFNDLPNTTHDMVLAMFDKAIATIVLEGDKQVSA